MHKRYYVQRQHIIHSLDTLLYQLHTLSFFLSPSIWLYICRIISQFQCSKPRELDPSRSLRFFFTMVLFLNLPSIWNHSQGAAEGRVIILDFIGMSYVPSKFQLLSLDILIITLQFLLTIIAYETSVYYNNEDEEPQDMLLPTPPPTLSIPLFQSSITAAQDSPRISDNLIQSKTEALTNTLSLVVDLRFNAIMTHLRHPPPPPRNAGTDPVLPLPNTTPWPLPAGVRMLMRASRQMREAGQGRATTTPAGEGAGEGRVPGAMDTPEQDR
ncbi:hypothetical protein B0H34DRAFT_795981 [Crassisporium funariophilum]|nr:hypothetical protein B0H34DRAFT_795981 [Crassisporium funariophilum]